MADNAKKTISIELYWYYQKQVGFGINKFCG